MARRRRRRGRQGENGAHGDGLGDQGELLDVADEVVEDGGVEDEGVEAHVNGSAAEPDVENDATQVKTNDAEPKPPAVFELVEEIPGRKAVQAPPPESGPSSPSEPAAVSAEAPQGERLARARELTVGGRLEEALALYKEITQDAPSNVRARNNLGVLYDELGHHELALEQLEAAHALDAEEVEVLVNLGSVLGSLGRFEDAERELRRAQRIAPEDPRVRASLGILFYRRGLYAQAEVELRWVCEHDPEHGPAHFYRGEALNRLGKVDAALETLERAVRLQPGNHRAYYTMGILFDRKSLREEAAAMYRKARELQRP